MVAGNCCIPKEFHQTRGSSIFIHTQFTVKLQILQNFRTLSILQREGSGQPHVCRLGLPRVGVFHRRLAQTRALCSRTAVSSAGHPSSQWKGTEFRLCCSPIAPRVSSEFHLARKCPRHSPSSVDSIPAVWHGQLGHGVSQSNLITTKQYRDSKVVCYVRHLL